MKRPHKLNIRLSEKEWQFVLSFENKTKTEVIRRALELYMQRTVGLRRMREALQQTEKNVNDNI